MSNPFTMSYAQFRDFAKASNLSWKGFQKVDQLPEGVKIIAIAGVWGEYRNIRCLFLDYVGNGYRRNITGSAGRYMIRELGVNAKELRQGEEYLIE